MRTALLLVGLLALACSGDGRVGRIVVVSIDTLRADRVGCYGDEAARTPHLDTLAERGVRFARAFSPAPLTLPSHSSLFTALDPPRHGVRHNTVFRLDEDVPTLAGSLGEAGFATAGFVGAFVLDGRFGLGRGFDVWDDDVTERFASHSQFSFAERRAEAVVDAAFTWLRDAPPRFLLFVHFYDPHADYDPPERFAGPDPYAGEIAYADEQLGRLLAELERAFGDEVLVAVTSDHGESLGEHREESHSYAIYDATQHVPLILAGPGLPAGVVVPEVVRLVDLAPTLLELAHAAPLPDADGRSLLPLVRGEPEAERAAYLETLATQLDMGWSPLLGLRTATHKYIRAPRPELYDVDRDPDEGRNLAGVEPERVAELDALLGERLEGGRPVEPNRELGPGDRERLEALGYVVGEPGEAPPHELGVVGGPDPKDHIGESLRLHHAAILIEQGRADQALELLSGVAGDGSRLLRLRASAALGAGRPEEALESLARLEERVGPLAADRVLAGEAYLALSRWDAARAEFEQAGKLAPEGGENAGVGGLARLAEAEGDLERAEALWERADRAARVPGHSRLSRALLQLRLGRPQEAQALLATLPAEFLARPTVAARLARAHLETGRPERAVYVLGVALAEHPKQALLLRSRGYAHTALGRSAAALADFRGAFLQDPTDPIGKNDFAWGLAVLGRDLDNALELSRSAVEELEAHPATLDTLATVHLAREEPAEALAVAERGLARDADDAVRRHLAFVRAAALQDLGRREAAVQAFRALDDAARLDPPWRERALARARALGLEPARTPEEASSDAG